MAAGTWVVEVMYYTSNEYTRITPRGKSTQYAEAKEQAVKGSWSDAKAIRIRDIDTGACENIRGK